MSGHNKWSKIKLKKGIGDAKKSKVFSKFAKLIAIAARGNPDPQSNATLKSVIDQARSFNMPKDNIERAIKKASDKDSTALKEITLQAVCPASVVLVIEGITDNTNRTISEIKTILNKHDAKLAEPGSLDWMFEKKGVFMVDPQGNPDDFEMQLIDAGADDILRDDDVWTVFVAPQNFADAQRALTKQSIATESAQMQYVPINPIIVDERTATSIDALIEALETHDDVNDVYTNMNN